MPEPYVSDLFVDRALPLTHILDWCNEENPTQHVLSVVGPPGVGKSYLLHHVHERLQHAGRLVFWVNLSRDSTIRGTCPDVVADSGLRDWLDAAIHLSSKRCPKVRPHDRTTSPEAVVFTLVTDLCERCDLKPILIVDGFEEIDEPLRDRLEESLLAQFIARSCTRIIIGRRDEYSLNSPTLRWTEKKETLSVMEGDEPKKQLETRLEKWTKRPQYVPKTDLLPPTLDLIATLDLQRAIEPYAWNHPGINSFLLDLIVPRHQARLSARLTAEDLRQCVVEVTSVARSKVDGRLLSEAESRLLSEAGLDRLVVIATKLPELWTSDDLMDKVKIVFEDAHLAELFQRGLVFNVEGTPQYTVAGGIRELVQVWQRVAHPSLDAQER